MHVMTGRRSSWLEDALHGAYPELEPFFKQFCGGRSPILYRGADGSPHDIWSEEGIMQGDPAGLSLLPLVPLLPLGPNIDGAGLEGHQAFLGGELNEGGSLSVGVHPYDLRNGHRRQITIIFITGVSNDDVKVAEPVRLIEPVREAPTA